MSQIYITNISSVLLKACDKMKERLIKLGFLSMSLLIWELIAYCSPVFLTYFSSPSKILTLLVEKVLHGDLLFHISITALEAFSGLIIGTILGCCLGFLLIYYPRVSKYSYVYIVALSSIPTFALAPLMIIWFGTGISMKIALAFFSTVFVCAFQAYEGAKRIDNESSIFFEIYKADKRKIFWMLVFPSSLDWVIQSLKLNAGFCLLGAFIGEFIASEAGLGYLIVKASGLYDISYVLVCILCIVFLSLSFSGLAKFFVKNKLKIIRFMSHKFSK